MTEYIRRCGHCGEKYTYQGSGAGCGRPENDAVFCPFCKRIQLDALSRVTRKCEGRYQDVREIPRFQNVSLVEALEWEKAQEVKRQKLRDEGKIVGVRVFMGLVKIDTGEWQKVREVVAQDGPHQGRRFKVATWPNSPEYEISIEMEYDLVNNRFTNVPWDC